jgi:hypothetical protein
MKAMTIAAMLLLTACESESDKRLQEKWAGAVVVKICRSGAYVYRLRDGEFWTGGWTAQRVLDADTVCH